MRHSRQKFISIACATAVALLMVGSSAAVAAVTHAKVRGKLQTDAEDSRSKCRFRIDVWERGDNSRERLDATAIHLDATRDAEGNRPEYHIWLVDSDGETEADFGAVRLNRHGNAVFRWRSKRHDLPDDVDSVAEFGGGTIELRDSDDAVVLDGEIPEFVGLTDDNGEGSGAGIRGKDRTKLKPPEDVEDSDAEGRMKAVYANRPRRVNQSLCVKVKGLPSGDGPYTAVAIDDTDTETELGEIETVTRRGIGVLRLKTKDGDDIPGDSVLDLAGQDVEVRNADGDVVLVGTFPTIE